MPHINSFNLFYMWQAVAQTCLRYAMGIKMKKINLKINLKKINLKNINKKKLGKRMLILVIIVFVAFSFLKKAKPVVETQETMTTQAVIGRVESVISGNGTLSPANQYEVKSLVKGEILKASFEEGDTVKKGELLYQISTSDIENSIKTAELNVKKAKNAYKDCVEKKDKLVICSEDTGYIKKLYVKEGDTLQAGKTIADIYNGDIMYIDVLFPSDEVKKSWIGKAASVSLEAIGEVTKGVVTNVSSMEEVMGGGILTKKVTIRVNNKGGIMVGDTAEASIGDVASNGTGTFRAETETTLMAVTEGKIESLIVKEGQQIQKGDKVLSLSSNELESQLENADMGITEAKISLESQKDQMESYTIKAPIAGQVITKSKKQGDTIDPASDSQAGPMAIIYDMGYLTFQMNIDELQIRNIKVGQKVTISTEAFPGDTFDGVVDRISLKGNTNNGVTAYPVIVKVEKFGDLLPGMNITGKIMIEEADNVLTIPSSALQIDNTVYVKTEDATKNEDPAIPSGFKSVKVVIGINDGTNVEIKEGLTQDDMVYIPFDDSVMGYYDNMYAE